MRFNKNYIIILMFFSVFLSQSTSFAKVENRKRYIRADIRKYYIPPVQPKKYVYDVKTGNLVEYTYNKLLPSQVSLRTQKKLGVGVQLRPISSIDNKKTSTNRTVASVKRSFDRK